MSSVLVTGAAGFIGAHAAAALAAVGHRVVGCDDFNAYYPAELKRARVAALLGSRVPVERVDVTNLPALQSLMERHEVSVVLHLAAQAGVRHSVQAPMEYVQANLLGFGAVLEACRRAGVAHLLYASSSSVYGSRPTDLANPAAGFSEADRTDRPASFYAATKLANEAMAFATAQVHGLPVTGLRLFTVYGPWGRPDMAYWAFAERLLADEPLTLYGQGELWRDFTFIDDVTDALTRLVARGGPQGPVPAELLNVGHRQPVRVIDFVQTLAQVLGCEARLRFAPLPPGDVPHTCANPQRLIDAIGPWATTTLPVGLGRFAQWFGALGGHRWSDRRGFRVAA